MEMGTCLLGLNQTSLIDLPSLVLRTPLLLLTDTRSSGNSYKDVFSRHGWLRGQLKA